MQAFRLVQRTGATGLEPATFGFWRPALLRAGSEFASSSRSRSRSRVLSQDVTALVTSARLLVELGRAGHHAGGRRLRGALPGVRLLHGPATRPAGGTAARTRDGFWDAGSGTATFAYAVVRTRDDPRAPLLAFFQLAYLAEAAARDGTWRHRGRDGPSAEPPVVMTDTCTTSTPSSMSPLPAMGARIACVPETALDAPADVHTLREPRLLGQSPMPTGTKSSTTGLSVRRSLARTGGSATPRSCSSWWRARRGHPSHP